MFRDLLMGSKTGVVPDTGVTDEVGQDGRQENVNAGESGKCADKQCLFSTTNKLVTSTNIRQGTLEKK